MRDPAFGNNDFNTPKYYSETQTIVNNIMMLLLGKPGFYPNIPKLGMNIRNLLYKPIDSINTEALKVELILQCSQFIKEVRDGTFDVRVVLYQNQPLILFVVPVVIEEETYALNIGVTTNVQNQIIHVSNLANA